MDREVVAFPRRDRVVLALLASEDVGPGGVGRLTVVAEDGARFAIPADQVIARFPGVLAGVADGPAATVLAALRAAVERRIDWEEVHGRLEPGATLTFDQVAAAVGAGPGADAPSARLGVALALAGSDPWFRRNGVTWSVTSREAALARLAAADAAHRVVREDAAFLAWWPRRASSPPPADAAGAIEAVRGYALRGEAPAAERGRALAARVDLHEPDQATEALVAVGLLADDVNPAPWRAGLADAIPLGASDEARRLAAVPASHEGREDLSGLFAVAVDDEETTEVDDAVSVRRAAAGVEVLVHISDGAAAVPMGGPLDDAARARVSSLYAPDGAVAMLPPELVSGRASLEAGVDREAVTAAFVVREDGSVQSARFFRSVVRVTRRLTYDATHDPASLAATPEDAALLVAAARALRDARVRGGALVTGLPSLKIRADGGVPRIELRHQDTPGDAVVGEAAVLYNAEVGKLLAARDVAALFRTQDAARSGPPATSSPLWPVLVRRRFAPTHLRTEPMRHHGVGHDAYAQATSPLRRYADLVNQRQLVAVLRGEAPPYRPADLETLATHVSERERTVRRASSDREAYWIARWVQAQGLTHLDGVLARAPRRGLGSVWVDALLAELPLRPPDGWTAPPDGTRARWRIDRVLPWRGRIELAPPDAAV